MNNRTQTHYSYSDTLISVLPVATTFLNTNELKQFSSVNHFFYNSPTIQNAQKLQTKDYAKTPEYIGYKVAENSDGYRLISIIQNKPNSIISLGWDSFIREWSQTKRKVVAQTMKIHAIMRISASYAGEENLMLMPSSKGFIIRNLTTGTYMEIEDGSSGRTIPKYCFLNSQQLLVGLDDGSLKVFNLKTQQLIKKISLCTKPITALKRLNNNLIAVGEGSGKIILYNLANDKTETLSSGRNFSILSLRKTANRNTMVTDAKEDPFHFITMTSASSDNQIHIWDVDRSKLLRTINCNKALNITHKELLIAYTEKKKEFILRNFIRHSNGNILAYFRDGSMHVYDFNNCELLKKFPSNSPRDIILSCKELPDGNIVSLYSSGELFICDFNEGKLLQTLGGRSSGEYQRPNPTAEELAKDRNAQIHCFNLDWEGNIITGSSSGVVATWKFPYPEKTLSLKM